MQQYSRVAATAARFYRASSLAPRGFGAGSTGRTADPAVSSRNRDHEMKPAAPTGKPEEIRDHYEPETGKRETETETSTENRAPSKGIEPLAPPRPPYASSHRLETVGVNNPVEPQTQQRREKSTATNHLQEVICAGFDGTPWPKAQEKQQVEDNDNEYYKHHKASPLSEIEIADTRKPITRATDGTADAGKGRDVIGWLPEQLDTAEESLERASRIWRENAMRGDPDSPHGRVLRVLRGEWF